MHNTFPQIAPIYQYWNSHVHDHYHTQLIQVIGVSVPGQHGNHGYIAEGVAFHLLSVPSSGVVPLHWYRVGGQNSDNFYTTDAGEIGTTTVGQAENHCYVYEGVPGYCYKTQVPGTFPLYRFYGAGEMTIFIPKAIFHMKLQDTNMKELNVMFTNKHL